MTGTVLELTWDIDPVFVQLGPVSISYYGICFVGVFLGGWLFFRWQVLRGGGTEREAAGMLFTAAMGVLIGARLGHVIFYDYDRALGHPLWVLQVWDGGLSSHGATVGMLVAIWFYGRYYRQSYFESLDRFAFSAALGATLVRVGNFANSEIVGRLTDGSWGVRFPRYDHAMVEAGAEAPLRHPSQLYEIALGLFVLLVLWRVDRALGKDKRPRLALIATFFTVYFAGRFFVEFFKAHQVLGPSSPLSMGQILSIPATLAGVVGFTWSLRRGPPSHWRTPDEE